MVLPLIIVSAGAGVALGVGSGAAAIVAHRVATAAPWTFSDVRTILKSRIISIGVKHQTSLRREFQQTFTIPEVRVVDSHPHGLAAAIRTAASDGIAELAVECGMEEYIVSTATRDDVNAPGYHQYYEPKDFQHQLKLAQVRRKTHIIKIIDADYYLDINKYIATGAHIALYTCVPQRVARDNGDAEFVYNIDDDTIHYVVSGGCRYEHKLWDYDRDFAVIPSWWGKQIITIDAVQADDTHRVVFIAPVARVYFPFSLFIQSAPIKRRRFTYTLQHPTRGSVRINAIRSLAQDPENNHTTLQVSLSLAGSFVGVTFPEAHLASIVSRYKETTSPSISTIERYLRALAEDFPGMLSQPDFIEAANLYPLIQLIANDPSILGAIPVLTAAARPVKRPPQFQAIGNRRDGYLVSEDGHSNGRLVGEPVVTPIAVVPKDSYNNDLQCVIGRIERVYNPKVPPRRYIRYANEYTRLIADKLQTYVPWTIEAVVEAQSKPMQRLKNVAVLQWITHRPGSASVRAFMKKEAYGKVTDPRNISQLPPEHNLKLGRYVYAISEGLHTLTWYSPGQTPCQIADNVHRFVRERSVVYPTDYSRWDGTVSIWMRRHLEAALLLRWAPERERSDLRALLKAELSATGVTKYGVKYDPAGTRLSGSILTSFGNTIMNAFVSYCAYREAGYYVMDAWRSLGPTCGDDGITAAPEVYMLQAARDLGLQLKIDRVTPGQDLPYLGRVYPDPWSVNWSYQDPRRTLQKLAISFAPLSVPDHVALYNRANGYLTLDPTAPILAPWCVHTINGLRGLLPDLADGTLDRDPIGTDTPYYAILVRTTGAATWPAGPEDDPLAYGVYARSLGISEEEVRDFDHYLRSLPVGAKIDRQITLPPLPENVQAHSVAPDVSALCGPSHNLPGPPSRQLVDRPRNHHLPTNRDRTARSTLIFVRRRERQRYRGSHQELGGRGESTGGADAVGQRKPRCPTVGRRRLSENKTIKETDGH